MQTYITVENLLGSFHPFIICIRQLFKITRYWRVSIDGKTFWHVIRRIQTLWNGKKVCL